MRMKKKVFSPRFGESVNFEFLRWSLSHFYNHEMNDNDITDQLRLIYRMMSLQKNTKWWWALWQWAVEISLVNAYLMMHSYCQLKGLPPKYTHHDFNEICAKALLDPVNHWPNRFRLHSWYIKECNTPLPNQPSAKSSNDSDLPVTRATKFTDTTLHTTRGRLRTRLNGNLPHVCQPIESKAKRVCQLHRWAYRKHMQQSVIKCEITDVPPGGKKHVMSCSLCGVSLCVNCWECFHSVQCLEVKIPFILAST